MSAFRQIFVASLKEFVRDPTGLSAALLLPLLFIFFFGFSFPGQYVPATLPNGSTGQAAGLRWVDFIVPGILALSIMNLGVFAAIPLTAQRELGILRRFGVTPVPRPLMVAAQVTARLAVSLVQVAVQLATAWLVFGVPFTDLGALGAVTLLGALAFVTLGYTIAALAPTSPAAHGWTQLVSMPMIFLSGIFVPVTGLPAFLQPLVLVLPLTYLADAMRQLALGGVGAAFPLGLDLTVLAAWTLVLGTAAVRWFRWT